MAVALVQEWSAASSVSTLTGPETTAGNLLILRGTHRAGTSGLTVTLSDPAGNPWTLAGSPVAGGSGDGFLFYCEGADAVSAVSIGGPDLALMYLTEWSGVAVQDALLQITSQHNPSSTQPPPALVTTAIDGAMIYGSLSATVSNRTFTLQTPSFIEGGTSRSQSMTSQAAYVLDAPAGTHGPEWDITSGGGSTSGAVTVAFRAEGDDPPPGRAEGAATGTVAWAGVATGDAPAIPTHTGAAHGALQWAGTSAGQAPDLPARAGTATGDTTWAVAATGRAPAVGGHAGTARTDLTWSGVAGGARTSKAVAVAGHAWAGTATGAAPTVDGRAGTAATTHSWAGHATGARPSRATATTHARWTGAATGATTLGGEAATAIQWTAAARGTNVSGRDITLTITGPHRHPLTIGPHAGHPLTITAMRS